MSASSTSSTIIHPLHAQPFAIASDTLSCSCVQCQPFSFCHIHLQAQDYGGSLAHSLLHLILLSLPVQVQPSKSTSLTWTPFGELFGLTFLFLLAFPANFFYIDIISNYNSLALSHSTPTFRPWGQSSTSQSSFLLERIFLAILS